MKQEKIQYLQPMKYIFKLVFSSLFFFDSYINYPRKTTLPLLGTCRNCFLILTVVNSGEIGRYFVSRHNDQKGRKGFTEWYKMIAGFKYGPLPKEASSHSSYNNSL